MTARGVTAAGATAGPRWSWGAAVVLALVGAVALLWRPTAPPVVDTAAGAALTTFPPAVLAEVAAWVGPIRVTWPLRVAIALGVPVWLVASARGRRLVDAWSGTRFATLRGALLPPLAAAVALAPFTWWLGWRHAGAFGFRTSGPLRFVTEHLGAVALEAALTAATALLLLWLVRRRPHDWPAVGTLLGTALTALLVVAQPLVTTAVLYRPQPLDDPAVAAAVQPVLDRAGLPDAELLVGEASVRTTRVNAFVNGLGPTEQVVLYDTLLLLDEDRIAAVVAHELAHRRHDDLPRGVLGAATGILLALLLARAVLRRAERRRGQADGDGPALRGGRVGATVVAVLLVAQFVGDPVVAWQSRRVEAAADHAALELTRDPAGVVAVSRGFVVDDLADPTPPAWVRLRSTHPTPAARIRAAAAFAAREGIDLPVSTLLEEGGT